MHHHQHVPYNYDCKIISIYSRSSTWTVNISIMVTLYVKGLVCLLVLSIVCEGQSDGVFIVYPFKEGDINPSRSKFSVRNVESETRRKPKMLNDLNVHLVYPVNESVVIMTPASVQESDDSLLETTTVMDSSTERFGDFQTAEETTTDYQSENMDLETTEKNEDGTTSAEEMNLTTTLEDITTEIPIKVEESLGQEPKLVDIIYEQTGSKKTLRKRMFDAGKFSRKYPTGLKMNSSVKVPTTMSPIDTFKSWYKKTSRNKVMKEKLIAGKSDLKTQSTDLTMKETPSENLQRRRYNLRTYL